MVNIPLDTRLETERGYLRCLSLDDVDFSWSASQSPGFTDGMSWEPPKHKEEIVERTKEAHKRWRRGEDFSFTLYLRESDVPVGRISIRTTDTEHVWDTGYWVHPDFQGQGYATEMLKAIVKFACTTLKATRITSAHASWNEASGKVLQKAGFTHIGHNPCGFKKNGKCVPEEEYEITKKPDQ